MAREHERWTPFAASAYPLTWQGLCQLQKKPWRMTKSFLSKLLPTHTLARAICKGGLLDNESGQSHRGTVHVFCVREASKKLHPGTLHKMQKLHWQHESASGLPTREELEHAVARVPEFLDQLQSSCNRRSKTFVFKLLGLLAQSEDAATQASIMLRKRLCGFGYYIPLPEDVLEHVSLPAACVEALDFTPMQVHETNNAAKASPMICPRMHLGARLLCLAPVQTCSKLE